MKKITIIVRFEKDTDGDKPVTLDMVIQTRCSRPQIDKIIEKVQSIKVAADDPYSDEDLYGYVIPEGWKDWSWEDKVTDIMEYLEKTTEKFEILHVNASLNTKVI